MYFKFNVQKTSISKCLNSNSRILDRKLYILNVNVLSSLLWISDQRENYKRHNKENQNAYKVA